MSAERFGVQEARQRFPELLVRASKGERLVIQRHRQDLAAIVPLQDAAGGPSSQEAMENLLSLKGSAKERSAQQRTPGEPVQKLAFKPDNSAPAAASRWTVVPL